MKRIKNILIALSVVSLTGCDYLDIVPDERNTEFNTYENEATAKKYLYGCYSYIPNSRGSDAIDKMTGGEIVVADERKTDAFKFPQGYYSPSAPTLAKTQWEACYNGIRTCWEFLAVVDKTPNISEEQLPYYKAEAHLLIAYYHWLLVRAFGPIMIMDHAYDASTPYAEYPERSSYDKCVEYIDGEITIALEGLKTERYFESNDYGRLTRYCALALRSRMYLYAASPLFNGNSEFYSNFKNSAGENLISQTYSVEKWQKAAEVTLDAITQMEAAGFRLYNTTDVGAATTAKPGMNDLHERAVRWAFMDNPDGSNPEVIWADTRPESAYMIANQSTPYQQSHPKGNKNSWSLIAPTINTVEQFYTTNGLPIDQDPAFNYEKRYEITKLTAQNYTIDPSYLDGCPNASIKAFAAGKPLKNDTVMNLHLGREPRFYAWIGFQNGPFEITNFYGFAIGDAVKRIIKLDMKYNQEQGWDGRDANFSRSGYLNKKFVSPLYTVGPAQGKYPYPVFRMAEMYLNYAEALIEIGGDGNLALAKTYIDKVRERAGINKIDVAWQKAKNPEKAKTQEGLREIVRQERQIEFYLENQRFWDVRRWRDAECLGEQPKALNINGKTDETFHQVVTLDVIRNFEQKNYLMPIPIGEINKVPQIIQNPGY